MHVYCICILCILWIVFAILWVVMGGWTTPLLGKNAIFSHCNINSLYYAENSLQASIFRVEPALRYHFDPTYSFKIEKEDQIISVCIQTLPPSQESIVRKCKLIAHSIVATLCEPSETALT